MTRVSSFGQQQLLINSLMQNQERVFERQQQLATGKRTDEYAGLGGDTGTVLGSKSFLSRVETYRTTISTVRGKLDANDVQIGGMLNAAETLKDNVLSAIANNQAEGFSEILDQTYRFIKNSLNTNFDGTYLFAGARSGVPPVNADSLADLNALPAISDAFDNGSETFQAKVADGVDLEFGLLASDIAQEIFTVLNDLYVFDTGPGGPLQGPMTDAQFAYLRTELGNLTAAIDDMRQVEVNNGLVYERVDVVDQQHEDTEVFLEVFVAELEDVDIAETVTRLNNDQLALEASYQTVSSLSQLTLLRFI